MNRYFGESKTILVFVSTYASQNIQIKFDEVPPAQRAPCISGFLRLSAAALGDLRVRAALRVALAPLGLPRPVVAPSRRPAPRSRLAPPRLAPPGWDTTERGLAPGDGL